MNPENLAKLGAVKTRRQTQKKPEEVPSHLTDKASKAKQKKQFKSKMPSLSKNDTNPKKFNIIQPGNKN